MAPAKSRVPLPWPMLCAIATKTMEMDCPWQVAACLVLMYKCYLRPCDVLPLKVKDLVRPVVAGDEALSQWTVVLHAREDRLPSKTGEFDEVLLLDGPGSEKWRPTWIVLKAKAKHDSLFNLSYRQLAVAFSKAVRSLDYEKAGIVHLYQLRHGGASHDAASHARDMLSSHRDRWASHRSLRRYENGGRLAEVMSRLTPSQVRHAKRQEACLHQVLGTACGRPSKDRVESSLKSSQAAVVLPRRGAKRKATK